MVNGETRGRLGCLALAAMATLGYVGLSNDVMWLFWACVAGILVMMLSQLWQ